MTDIDHKSLPKTVVLAYYEALGEGDLKSITSLMTTESYLMTLEVLCLKYTFNDDTFRLELKKIREDFRAKNRAEEMLSDDLKKHPPVFNIVIKNTDRNGPDRVTVNYEENTKLKKLYLAYTPQDGWKIDYRAGRRTF